MIKLVCYSGFAAATLKTRVDFKSKYKKDIEDFFEDPKQLDYIKELKPTDVIFFLRESTEPTIPIEILSCFVNEQDKYGYKARLLVNGHITAIEIVYNDNKATKYFVNEREAWPQIFDEGIDCGDMLFTAEENGFTKENCLEYLELFLRLNYDFRYKLNKDNLIIMEGL